MRRYNKFEDKEDSGVIRKVGSKWKILKKNRKDYWDADFDTKSDAQSALRAYWANKHEEYADIDIDDILTEKENTLEKRISRLEKLISEIIYR